MACILLGLVLAMFSPSLAFSADYSAARNESVAKPVIAGQESRITPNDFAFAIINRVQGLSALIGSTPEEANNLASAFVDMERVKLKPESLLTAEEYAQLAMAGIAQNSEKNLPRVMQVLERATFVNGRPVGREAAESARSFFRSVVETNLVHGRLSYEAREMGPVVFDGAGIRFPLISSVETRDYLRYPLVGGGLPASGLFSGSYQKSPAETAIQIWKDAHAQGDDFKSPRVPVLLIKDTLNWMVARVHDFKEELVVLHPFSPYIRPKEEDSAFAELLEDEILRIFDQEYIDNDELIRLSAKFAYSMLCYLKYREDLLEFEDKIHSFGQSVKDSERKSGRIRRFQSGALIFPVVQDGTLRFRSLNSFEGIEELIKLLPYPIHAMGFIDRVKISGLNRRNPWQFPEHDLAHALVRAANNPTSSGDEWLQRNLEMHERYERGRQALALDRERWLFSSLWLALFFDLGTPYNRSEGIRFLSDLNYIEQMINFSGRFGESGELNWMFTPNERPAWPEIVVYFKSSRI